MNHANLTARYRPQTFADLAGQETIRAILSRAAAEDRIAPAYLFSGTRGVGKTTVARIFAKALNCERAPVAEPCNMCNRCRQITTGTAVDVVEIDGATNRGIDDVRRLKEVVGYAPMEGRYRVFIIDEAHMLSREAFNGLLKTLEEPPAMVTFILASTESHKFPATILSRCQHYVFKSLPETALEEHLVNVLNKESVFFEAGALRLLARRAAGSVRDAMSLLGQVLALGGETLTEDDTRRVLGLAGQELLFDLFAKLRESDTVAIGTIIAQMLDSGLDLGFFLREMTTSWRNMFILREAGDRAFGVLNLPQQEMRRWQEEANRFDLAHIHAAWQMLLDGQRRVLTSLEPALALELLLFNIAMLPRLLPLDTISRLAKAGGTGETPPPAASGPASGGTFGPPTGPSRPSSATFGSSSATISAKTPDPAFRRPEPNPEQKNSTQTPPGAPVPHPHYEKRSASSNQGVTPPIGDTPDVMVADENIPDSPEAEGMIRKDDVPPASGTKLPQEGSTDRSWSAFMRFCKQQEGLSAAITGTIRAIDGEWEGGILKLSPASAFCANRLELPEVRNVFMELVQTFYGQGTAITMLPPPTVKNPAAIKEEVRAHPAVQLLEQEMGAHLVDCGLSQQNGPVQ